MRIPSGVTDQYIYFVAVDATDFTTRETGLATWTVYRSRDGGVAAVYTTPTINETDATNMPGVYELLLDEDMTIGSGNDSEEVCLHITHAGMAPVTRTFELYRPKVTAGETLTASGGVGSANVTQLLGTAWLTPGVPGTPDVNAKFLGAAAVTATTSVTIPAASTLATTAGAVGSVTGAVASVTGSVGSVTTVSSGAITAASFGASAIDAAALAPDAGTEIGAAVISALGSGTEVFGHSYLVAMKRIEVASGNSTLSGAGSGTEVLTSEDSSLVATYTVDASGNISAIGWV